MTKTLWNAIGGSKNYSGLKVPLNIKELVDKIINNKDALNERTRPYIITIKVEDLLTEVD